MGHAARFPSRAVVFQTGGNATSRVPWARTSNRFRPFGYLAELSTFRRGPLANAGLGYSGCHEAWSCFARRLTGSLAHAVVLLVRIGPRSKPGAKGFKKITPSNLHPS